VEIVKKRTNLVILCRIEASCLDCHWVGLRVADPDNKMSLNGAYDVLMYEHTKQKNGCSNCLSYERSW